MKKKIYAGICLGLMVALSACGMEKETSGLQTDSSAAAETEITVSAEKTETLKEETEASETENEEGQGETAETSTLEKTESAIETFLSMLGKTDEESEEILEGGQENVTDSGIFIGRIYEVELFGEKVQAGTLCDDSRRITTVTMQLEQEDASEYEGMLTEILGQPDEREEGASETGTTAVVWKEENKAVRLYQSYGLVSLEFQMEGQTE